VGIPRFIKGHNLQKTNEELTKVEEELSIKDSVWKKLSEEEKKRRLSNLKSFGKREDNPSWKGGRRIDERGYVQVLMPDHPFAKDGYMLEHRFLVEERVRRCDPENNLLVEVNGEKYIKPGSVVHHIDENKTNNASSNLMLLPNQAAHSFIHSSPLPMEERLRRIGLGIYHSRSLGSADKKDKNE
jgi:hypothetical protein